MFVHCLIVVGPWALGLDFGCISTQRMGRLSNVHPHTVSELSWQACFRNKFRGKGTIDLTGYHASVHFVTKPHNCVQLKWVLMLPQQTGRWSSKLRWAFTASYCTVIVCLAFMNWHEMLEDRGCPPIHPSSISLQNRAGLPWISTKHDIPNSTNSRHLPSY